MKQFNRNTKFSVYAQYVVEYKRSMGMKNSTYDSYLDLLYRASEYIGDTRLKSITSGCLNAMYADLGKKGSNRKTGGRLSVKTIVEHHKVISAVLDHAVKEDIIKTNVSKRAMTPKLKKTSVNYFQISQAREIERCLNSENIMWQLIIHLFLITGARRGEILGLKWHKIDISNSTMTFDSAIYYSRRRGVYEDSLKSEASVRTLQLPAETISMILKYRDFIKEKGKYNEQSYVFFSKTGKWLHPDSVNTWLVKFGERHGLDFHLNPHAFRHSMASFLFRERIDDVTISKRLGHAKVSTTSDIYAHIIDGADREAAECLAEIFLRKRVRDFVV